jgi:hypothetical protein
MSPSAPNRRRMNSAESVEEKRPHMGAKAVAFPFGWKVGSHTAANPFHDRPRAPLRGT